MGQFEVPYFFGEFECKITTFFLFLKTFLYLKGSALSRNILYFNERHKKGKL